MKLQKVKLNEIANAQLNEKEMLRILGGGSDEGDSTVYTGATSMGELVNPECYRDFSVWDGCMWGQAFICGSC
jgi:natural product precursor